MLGLWLEGGRLRLREDLPPPAPPPGEALVRVLSAGICNTDLELLRGYYPFRGVPGHEFVGVVEAGAPRLTGRRVVGEINAACGRCERCRAGGRNHCPERTVLGIVGRHGAFAELLALPAENLHPVPDGLATDAALFTEPLAAALQVQEQVPVRPGDRVLVVGDGKLGQLLARSLAPTGCRLRVLGRHPHKLALLQAAGIDAAAEPPADGGFDLAVECTGNPDGFGLARRALRPGGTLVLKSTYRGELSVDPSSLVVDEIRLIGSRCGPFRPALERLQRGEVEVLPLLEARHPLREGLRAFERAASPGALKVVLDVSPDP